MLEQSVTALLDGRGVFVCQFLSENRGDVPVR